MLGIFLLGGWEIILLLVFFFCLIVLPVCAVVAIVYIIANRGKSKPHATPIAPAPAGRIAPLAAPAAPVATHTDVIPRKCPQCGAALQPDAPEGLCPACLLQRGFATETGGAPAPSSFVPPPIDELARLFPQLEILECLGVAAWARSIKRASHA